MMLKHRQMKSGTVVLRPVGRHSCREVFRAIVRAAHEIALTLQGVEWDDSNRPVLNDEDIDPFISEQAHGAVLQLVAIDDVKLFLHIAPGRDGWHTFIDPLYLRCSDLRAGKAVVAPQQLLDHVNATYSAVSNS